jgi:hypothetical protein
MSTLMFAVAETKCRLRRPQGVAARAFHSAVAIKVRFGPAIFA